MQRLRQATQTPQAEPRAAIGPKGPTGPAGPRGVAGPAGPKGAAGPAGPKGAAGPPGPAGQKGATGPAGQKGSNGINGATGSAGATGLSGGITLNVTNSGTDAYLINGLNNPTISFIRGHRYIINVNAPGHPFWIQTMNKEGYKAENVYSSGITNGGTDNGTIIFEVPFDAPQDLSYVCQNHSSMGGNIIVSNLGPPGADGVEGERGQRGATGADGERGATGADGPRGATGADGARGATGADGPRGATGANGTNGAVGPAGPAGANGADGTPGPTGADGTDIDLRNLLGLLNTANISYSPTVTLSGGTARLNLSGWRLLAFKDNSFGWLST